MIELFRGSHFDRDISSWDISNVINMNDMFDGAEAFLDKYNNGQEINNPKEFLEKLREKE